MSRSADHAARVEITGLRKEFGDKVALNDVSLTLEPGSFTVLLGPSGSGKTTLLRCLAGIESPTSGSIRIGGQVVVGAKKVQGPEKRNLSMVFQDYALWPHMTVRKNVAYPLASSSLDRAEKQRRVDDLLDRVGIGPLAERFPNELSGGEQQRVALARALSADVGLILFDEPLSNLDADRREQLRIEIATLTRESGATAMYITHDQSEAFALADQVGVLQRGNLIQLATPEEIYRHPVNAFVTRFTGIAGEFPVVAAKQVGPDRVTVQLPFAPHLDVEATLVGSTACDQLGLFVRAAGVSLHASTHEGGAPGIVRDAAFTGRGYEHVIEVGPQSSIAKVFSTTRFDRDTHVKVDFDPASCFVMSSSAEGK